MLLLPWAKPITQNKDSQELVVWEFEEETQRHGKSTRIYLWLKELDYVVILERQSKRMGEVYMLVSTCHDKRYWYDGIHVKKSTSN